MQTSNLAIPRFGIGLFNFTHTYGSQAWAMRDFVSKEDLFYFMPRDLLSTMAPTISESP